MEFNDGLHIETSLEGQEKPTGKGQEVIPVFGIHNTGYLLQAKSLLVFWKLMRGDLPHTLIWNRKDVQRTLELDPSVIALDSVCPTHDNDDLFFYSGDPFSFLPKGRSEIFLVGGDFTGIKQVNHVLSETPEDNFTKRVLSNYISKQIPHVQIQRIAQEELIKPSKGLGFRNALIAIKAVEAKNRLGSKATDGPVAALLGLAHKFSSDEVWENIPFREKLIQSIFEEIFAEAEEINQGLLSTVQLATFTEELIHIFGATKVWRVGERPQNSRRRLAIIDQLIPLEDEFISPTIARLIYNASRILQRT